MIDDAQLLHTYVRTGDEAAFATLLDRHKGLVYGSALRQTNNPALAEEITQAVFIVLARKTASLKPGTILSGWLFRATRFIACDALKAEQRRVLREQISVAMNIEAHHPASGAPDHVWQEIAPVLDDALTHLGEKDRNALLLRFFEQKNLSEVGHALGIGEDGARKRVERALDKLRTLLGRRGVAVPAVALSTLLLANTVQAVPVTLTAGAVLGGTAAAAPLAKAALAFMALSKTKIALAVVVGLLCVNTSVLVTVLLVHRHSIASPNFYWQLEKRAEAVASVTSPPATPGTFVSLFNGTDLSGWKYNTGAWSVVNGTIVGRIAPELGMQGHSIIWGGGEVDDFEVHLKFRAVGQANSGVCFRVAEGRYGSFPGYQAELEMPRTGLFIIAGPGRERRLARAGWRTVAREENGQDVLEQLDRLSDDAQIAEARRTVSSGEWCDVSLLAQGPHIVIVLNGVTITDTRDEHPTKFVPRGLMGLEYTHNPGREDSVEFKDIQFRRLSASGLR